MGGALRIDPFPTLSSSQGPVFAGHGLKGLPAITLENLEGLLHWPPLWVFTSGHLSCLLSAWQRARVNRDTSHHRSEKQLDHPQALHILEGVPFLG